MIKHKGIDEHLEVVFQFYRSTIMMTTWWRMMTFGQEFQFYRSTIMMDTLSLPSAQIRNFNSTEVRLWSERSLVDVGVIIFQFYRSTIMIPHRASSAWRSEISILQKYDYDGGGASAWAVGSEFQFYRSTIMIYRLSQRKKTLHISILQKYDYDPVTVLSIWLIIYDFNSTEVRLWCTKRLPPLAV